MKRREIIGLTIFFLLLIYSAWYYFNRLNTVNRMEFHLDTIFEISASARNRHLDALLDSTFSMIAAYEKQLSYYSEDGLIGQINRSLGGEYPINSTLQDILRISGELYILSDSLYDVTIGPLTDIWDFDNGTIPSPDEIDAAQKKIGFHRLKISGNRLIKPPELRLNLGSLAKGYIIDEVVKYLKAHQVQKAIINAGGDMRIFGYSHPLHIGIQHPRKEQNNIINILEVSNQAVVTSGDYERFFYHEGKRYHHILNPRTGFPSENAISVTVVAEEAVYADAVSTALFLLPPAEAQELAENLTAVEAVIYFEREGEIIKLETSGIKMSGEDNK